MSAAAYRYDPSYGGSDHFTDRRGLLGAFLSGWRLHERIEMDKLKGKYRTWVSRGRKASRGMALVEYPHTPVAKHGDHMVVLRNEKTVVVRCDGTIVGAQG